MVTVIGKETRIDTPQYQKTDTERGMIADPRVSPSRPTFPIKSIIMRLPLSQGLQLLISATSNSQYSLLCHRDYVAYRWRNDLTAGIDTDTIRLSKPDHWKMVVLGICLEDRSRLIPPMQFRSFGLSGKPVT